MSTIVIKKIHKYPLYKNITTLDNGPQNIYFVQTFPKGSKNFVTITNFAGDGDNYNYTGYGDNYNYTGCPPSSLMYNFIYKPCCVNDSQFSCDNNNPICYSSNNTPCSSTAYTGWLQNKGSKSTYNVGISIRKVTWNNGAPQSSTYQVDNSYPTMGLAYYLDNSKQWAESSPKDWNFPSNVNHHTLGIGNNQSLNFRIQNDNEYDMTVSGYVLYYPK